MWESDDWQRGKEEGVRVGCESACILEMREMRMHDKEEEEDIR